MLEFLERVSQGDKVGERVAAAAGRVRYVEPGKRKSE